MFLQFLKYIFTYTSSIIIFPNIDNKWFIAKNIIIYRTGFLIIMLFKHPTHYILHYIPRIIIF